MSRVEDLIDRSADPARVREALGRLAEQHPDVGERLSAPLVAVLAASRSLGRVLCTDPLALAVLDHLGEREVPPPRGTGIDEVAGWCQREALRIAARDLTGLDALAPTTAALAAMAAECLAAAHHLATGTLGPDERLAVIGMGKLGGNELNYASDVDIVLVGEGDQSAVTSAARRFLSLAGRCFRVDVDLRPEGRDGPLVRTVESYEAYWQRWADPWERQALLKARPVAGDVDLGQRWSAAAGQLVWSRPFGADDLRSIRAMKVRTEEEVVRSGTADREVKRGPGGIRDVEFAAQILQLVHGPDDAELRTPTTLVALEALSAGGYVAPEDAASLAESYRFLRQVEHAVQLDDGRQTHTLPEARDERRRVARVLGFSGSPASGPTEAFEAELARRRREVRSAHERVWFRPLLDSLAGSGTLDASDVTERLGAFGFTDVERTRQAVVELTRGLTRSSRMMRQLLPLLLDWLSASPDPDLGLLGLRHLATGERRAAELAGTFRDSPEAARALALLLGTSRLLGEVLVANPDLIERLPHPDRLRTRARADLVASALGATEWRTEPSERQRALQRWTRRHLLGIAARDVLGHADVATVGDDLTALAEASLEAALAALDPQVPFAVIGLGRLGGADLGYASDLDVAFVHDGTTATAIEEAGRVATGIMRFLGGATPAERIWTMDADLRPDGRSAPLSRSVEGWRAHLGRWATWERQAYLRARPVAGDLDLAEVVTAEVAEATWSVPLTDVDVREIRRMKARIETERMPRNEDPEFHLKLGRGSLSDIEFTVQLLQLRHRVAGQSTLTALDRLTRDEALPTEDALTLAEAYRFCEGTRNRRFLVAGPGDSLPSSPESMTPLARSLGFSSAGLREEYRRLTRRARRVVEHYFYGTA